jgi:uncharacterized protein DUF4258
MASDTLTRVRALVAKGKVRVSDHGYDELVDDDILVIDVLDSIQSAILVEDYPEFGKGPSVLVLQRDDFSGMLPAGLYMSFGAFRRAAKNQPLW